MASFFVEVRHLNHQYDNEQDVDNGLQWLFSNDDEGQTVIHEEHNNAINRECPGCIQRWQLGYDDMCIGCKLYASLLFAIFMVLFYLPLFVFLIFI